MSAHEAIEALELASNTLEKNYENLAGVKSLLYFCNDLTLRHTV